MALAAQRRPASGTTGRSGALFLLALSSLAVASLPAANAQFRMNMGGGFGGGGRRRQAPPPPPPEPEIDLYEVLGLDEDCTDKEIKKAFRKLSLKYHPDKNPGNEEAAKMFSGISEAYEILSDESKKYQYDFGGMAAVKKGDQPDQMSMFGGLFGGGQQNSNKGPDMQMTFSVTLEQMYNGAQMATEIDRRVVCRGCKGKKAKGKEKCKLCGRCPNEVRMVQRQMGPGFMVQQQEEVKSEERCKQEKKEIELLVERGATDGTEQRFPHLSEQKPGQVPGDVVIIMKQKKHARFERRGDHLHYTMKISLKESLTGFSKDIKHLDGHMVRVERAAVTRPFLTEVKQGEGMPVHEVPSQFGDMHVTFEVEFPRTLSSLQMETLRTLL